jgi:fibulin 1/2
MVICFTIFVILENYLLLDIDECINDEVNNCSPNASCNNQVGSFECICKDGYQGNGEQCG